MTKKKTKKIERTVPNPETLKINMEQIYRKDYCGIKSIGEMLRDPNKYKKDK
jgi:hypothetical protein